MKKFLVKYDFNKCQPVWNKSHINTFGERNEGFIIEGDNEKQAFEAWNKTQKPGNQLNSFYVKITEIKE